MENFKNATISVTAEQKEDLNKVTNNTPPLVFPADVHAIKTNSPLRVGMLRRSVNLDKYSSTHLMVYMAKNFNIELYFFTPKDIDFENKLVHATLIEGNVRSSHTIQLPQIIFNSIVVLAGETGQKLRSKLEESGCYLIRQDLKLDKKKSYDLLLQSGQFREFLIETHLVETFDNFMSLLERYHNDVVLKPYDGHSGGSVFRITFDGEQYVVHLSKRKIFLKTVSELQNYYDKTFNKFVYILQPYIVSRSKLGNAFDMRIHVFRAPYEKFTPILYMRINGDPNGLVSNLGMGGYTKPPDKFLEAEFGDDWKMLRDKLMYIGYNLPKLYQTFFVKKFFEISIDVGIQRRDNSYELKIFEINSRSPGVPFIDAQTAFATLEYMQYLGKTLK